MKIFSWNCQGLGNPKTVQTLQTWVWRERPNIVFSMETMIDSKKLQLVKEKCGFRDGICLSSVGLSGGIGFWWNELNVPLWAAVGINGWPEASSKHHTWSLMKEIRDSVTVPIIFFGDFNEILHASEKDGGAVPRESQMNDFRESVELCGIRDLGFRGGTFTWRRGNDPNSMIRERLDRFMACDEWETLFSQYWFVISLFISLIIADFADYGGSRFGARKTEGFSF